MESTGRPRYSYRASPKSTTSAMFRRRSLQEHVLVGTMAVWRTSCRQPCLVMTRPQGRFCGSAHASPAHRNVATLLVRMVRAATFVHGGAVLLLRCQVPGP